MDEETKYIPYGTDEIDYNLFLLNSANSVLNYVNSQPWSQKRKKSFLNAYLDLMTRGVTGASNTSGVWTIDVGDQKDIDSLSKIDREMYGEAAYFIQQQMSKLPTKSSQLKKVEDEKSKLPAFDNNYFTSQFHTHISNKMFGGRDWKTQEDWNIKDEREENGLRGTTNRANALANMLESYSNSLEEGKYNFENSPFLDLNDFKTRIGNVVTILRNGETDKYLDALNSIGLRYDDYFYNGSKDTFSKDGYEGSYEDYYGRYLPEQEELKKKALQEEAQQKAIEQQADIAKQRSSGYKRLTYLYPKNNNIASLEDLSKYPDIISQLNTYSNLDSLNQQQIAELLGAFKLALDKGLLLNPSGEELKRFYNFGRNFSTPGRLKKIQGLNGFYWDTVGNRIIKPSMTNPNQLLNLVNQGKTKPLSEKWTAADTADVVSIIGDFVSLGGFMWNVGGSLTSITADAFSDYARGKSNSDILKHLGTNMLWAAAGLIPLGKAPKILKKTITVVPKMLSVAASAGIMLDPEVQASAMKFTTEDGLKSATAQDLENLKYLFHAVTGGINTAKAHARSRQYRNQVLKQEVKTSDGSTIKLSDKQVKLVNKAGRKGGQKAAEDKFKEVSGGKEAALGSFNFSDKSRLNPTRYSSVAHRVFTDDKKLEGTRAIDEAAATELINRDKERSWYNWNKGYTSHNLNWLGVDTKKLSTTNATTNPTNTPTNPNVNPTNPNGAPTPTSVRLTRADIRNNRIVNNAINPSAEHLLKTQKKLVANGTSYEAVLDDGNKYTFGFKDNVLTIKGNGIDISKPASQQQVKLEIANFIKQQCAKTIQLVNAGRRKFSPEFIKSIQEMKRIGLSFKQGGRLDTTINDFFIKNNLL